MTVTRAAASPLPDPSPSTPPSEAPGSELGVRPPAPSGLAHPPSAQALASHTVLTAPPLDVALRPADVASAVNTLNALLDSFGSLLLAQQQLREEGVTRGTDAAEAGASSADNALQRQREAMEATQRAQRRANRLLGGAPRWVKKLVAGIITAVGAVAGAFSGGAAAGLAIAGAVLILAGDAVSKLMVKAGVDPDKAAWVGFALKVVGTALSLGAGAAGGAASTASAAREAIGVATRVINTVSTVADLGTGVTASAFTYQASQASADADAAGLELDLAHEHQEEAVFAVQEAHQTYQRVLERMQSWLTSQQDTTRALVAHLTP